MVVPLHDKEEHKVLRCKTCSKQHTPQEQVLDFEKFLFYLRFNALKPNEEEEHNQGIGPLWGRFPPECHYNMDQVPFPFVVNQDSTFALGDEENVHIPDDKMRHVRRMVSDISTQI